MEPPIETVVPPRPLDVEEVRRCTELLKAVTADRMLLNVLSEEDRRNLLIAAGMASRPERHEIMKLSKRHRIERRRLARERDRETRAATEIRVARQSPVFLPPPRLETTDRAPRGELRIPRNCYICKIEFRKLHFFYDALCPECGDYNYEKRFQSARLDGRVAVITGARLKIGYQAALMMLRAGATVIVTTRFPRDSAERYAREPDFAEWSSRLRVHGLDLRHSPSIEAFCRHVLDTMPRLDILVNNAAQTVRRPPGFYAHMKEKEEAPYATLPESTRRLLSGHEELRGSLAGHGSLPSPKNGAWLADFGHEALFGVGVRESARLSMQPREAGDLLHGADIFPEGQIDADLQQVDLRRMNSWRMKLADVATPELIEVQLVNSIAPYVLCAKLKPLMLRDRTDEKHVVNVSAMEGKFTRFTKTDKHPHTNMAKAALNMMTLTSAPDFAEDGIFMNAVDTGWVTDEDPAQFVEQKQRETDFQPPLDIVDGAARICDPFFSGILTGSHPWGRFLKDYKPTSW